MRHGRGGRAGETRHVPGAPCLRCHACPPLGGKRRAATAPHPTLAHKSPAVRHTHTHTRARARACMHACTHLSIHHKSDAGAALAGAALLVVVGGIQRRLCQLLGAPAAHPGPGIQLGTRAYPGQGIRLGREGRGSALEWRARRAASRPRPQRLLGCLPVRPAAFSTTRHMVPPPALQPTRSACHRPACVRCSAPCSRVVLLLYPLLPLVLLPLPPPHTPCSAAPGAAATPCSTHTHTCTHTSAWHPSPEPPGCPRPWRLWGSPARLRRPPPRPACGRSAGGRPWRWPPCRERQGRGVEGCREQWWREDGWRQGWREGGRREAEKGRQEGWREGWR